MVVTITILFAILMLTIRVWSLTRTVDSQRAYIENIVVAIGRIVKLLEDKNEPRDQS